MKNREQFQRQADIDELYAKGNKPAPPASKTLQLVYVNATGTPPAAGVTTFASPYTAQPFDWVVCDASAEDITVNLPTLAPGQYVSIGQDSNTAFNHQIHINAHAGQTLDQPPPDNGSFVSEFSFGVGVPTFAPPGAVGMRVEYYNGGSSGLLLE